MSIAKLTEIVAQPEALRVLFSHPRRLTEHSYWYEHIPFAMWLVAVAKPHVIVELGTHYGESYCAFCQAVDELNLSTKCYAVDNWEGDLHYGSYGSEVLTDLRAHHDSLYIAFSTLVKSDFQEARKNFGDGEIDLLHIDGTHTYEAVKRDWEQWLPKMSRRGVILLHDTNVVGKENYEVKRFFGEIKPKYPHFEFLHGYGLGVVLIGDQAADALRQIADADDETMRMFRQLFYRLGRSYSTEAGLNKALCEISDSKATIGNLNARVSELEVEKSLLQSRLDESRSRLDESRSRLDESEKQRAEAGLLARSLHDQLAALTSSRAWRIMQWIWRVRRALFPGQP